MSKFRTSIWPPTAAVAWQRCEVVVNNAERESLRTVLEQWGHRS